MRISARKLAQLGALRGVIGGFITSQKQVIKTMKLMKTYKQEPTPFSPNTHQVDIEEVAEWNKAIEAKAKTNDSLLKKLKSK